MSTIEFIESDFLVPASQAGFVETGERKIVTVDVVIRATTERSRVPRNVLLSKDRHRAVSLVRHVAMYLSRHAITPTPSFPDIGRSFAREHTTVMSAIRKIERAIAGNDRDVLALITDLRVGIAQNVATPALSAIARLP